MEAPRTRAAYTAAKAAAQDNKSNNPAQLHAKSARPCRVIVIILDVAVEDVIGGGAARARAPKIVFKAITNAHIAIDEGSYIAESVCHAGRDVTCM
eukprot:CAMPEP_0114435484 /NCGR_PEP_ID=MMETSP0103-20121206/12869_1 /TAXON_ID=37642 ORGANISM="Paraphysomonas imperforata, Strain PA2" /NCGR_SAMPLE_ID=MMETSP0103 /ASSEMBLY_ACC=CAM_ASM_000201 /LENGTH=95 /DNA_ID=CAMNT_0001605541 /DNA_START=178 /DNA_END=462 /DNA_ORIENTATION=-